MSHLMKRSVLMLGLFFSITYNAHAQTKNTKVLVDTYNKGFLSKNKDTAYYQKAFFDAFPANFKSLKKEYGWSDNHVTKLPLSIVPPNYFSRFFNMKGVDQHTMMKKMINVSINANWYANAIGTFQQSSVDYVLIHNKEFMKVLKTYSKKDIVSVWTFYYDYKNDTYRKGAYDKMVKVTTLNDKKMIPEITEGYKRSTKNWSTKQY
jgi:hypothetical protein